MTRKHLNCCVTNRQQSNRAETWHKTVGPAAVIKMQYFPISSSMLSLVPLRSILITFLRKLLKHISLRLRDKAKQVSCWKSSSTVVRDSGCQTEKSCLGAGEGFPRGRGNRCNTVTAPSQLRWMSHWCWTSISAERLVHLAVHPN